MKEVNKVETKKLAILDGIELKSAMFINKRFPLHFHHDWSLGYIAYGSENISFENPGFSLHKNAIVLIPPYSLHENWGNENSPWSYKAFYINTDVIKEVAKRIDMNYSYLSSFPYFVSYSGGPIEISEYSIFRIIENLFLDHSNGTRKRDYKVPNHAPYADIINYLSLNFNQSITLSSLEKKFKINKYNLQKGFKQMIGLSPLDYQTAIRIENSKKLFYKGFSLVEIALESGFYDQSHFSHSFKKYVGVTPGNYKKNTNILQD